LPNKYHVSISQETLGLFVRIFQYVFADSNNIYQPDAKKEKENNDLSQPNKQKIPGHAQKAKIQIHIWDKLHEPKKKGLLNICRQAGFWTIKCHKKKERCIAVNTKKTRMNPEYYITVKRFALFILFPNGWVTPKILGLFRKHDSQTQGSFQKESFANKTNECRVFLQKKVFTNGIPVNALQHTATHCEALQHTATHCNTLQHTATYNENSEVVTNGIPVHSISCGLFQHCSTL